MLYIDGKPAIDNDGLHGASAKIGAFALAKGTHPFQLVWFNATGGAVLDLTWAQAGEPFRAIPESAYCHTGGNP